MSAREYCAVCGVYLAGEMIERHPRYPTLCVECGDGLDVDLTPEQLREDQRLREIIRGEA